MQMVQIRVLRILLFFVCVMNQNVKPASVWIPIHDGVKLLLMQRNHPLDCFAKSLEQLPCDIAIAG